MADLCPGQSAAGHGCNAERLVAGFGHFQTAHTGVEPVTHCAIGIVIEGYHIALRIDGTVRAQGIPTLPDGGGTTEHGIQPGRIGFLHQKVISHIYRTVVRQGKGQLICTHKAGSKMVILCPDIRDQIAKRNLLLLLGQKAKLQSQHPGTLEAFLDMSILVHQHILECPADVFIEGGISLFVRLMAQDMSDLAHEVGGIGKVGSRCPLGLFHVCQHVLSRCQPVTEVEACCPDVLVVAHRMFFCHPLFVGEPCFHAIILVFQYRYIPCGLIDGPGDKNCRITPDGIFVLGCQPKEAVTLMPAKAVVRHEHRHHAVLPLTQGQIPEPFAHESGNIHIEGCGRGEHRDIAGPAAALIPLGAVRGNIHKVGLQAGEDVALELIDPLVGAFKAADAGHSRVQLPGANVVLGDFHTGNRNVLEAHKGKLGKIFLLPLPADVGESCLGGTQVLSIEPIILYDLTMTYGDLPSGFPRKGAKVNDACDISAEIDEDIPVRALPDAFGPQALMPQDGNPVILFNALGKHPLVEFCSLPAGVFKIHAGIVDFTVKERSEAAGIVRGDCPCFIGADDGFSAISESQMQFHQKGTLGAETVALQGQSQPSGIPAACYLRPDQSILLPKQMGNIVAIIQNSLIVLGIAGRKIAIGYFLAIDGNGIATQRRGNDLCLYYRYFTADAFVEHIGCQLFIHIHFALAGDPFSNPFHASLRTFLRRFLATSKNSVLMIWARDFVPNQVTEIPEYFVYCEISATQSWSKRSAQIAKGEF